MSTFSGIWVLSPSSSKKLTFQSWAPLAKLSGSAHVVPDMFYVLRSSRILILLTCIIPFSELKNSVHPDQMVLSEAS